MVITPLIINHGYSWDIHGILSSKIIFHESINIHKWSPIMAEPRLSSEVPGVAMGSILRLPNVGAEPSLTWPA
jgi:hypothetical protein